MSAYIKRQVLLENAARLIPKGRLLVPTEIESAYRQGLSEMFHLIEIQEAAPEARATDVMHWEEYEGTNGRKNWRCSRCHVHSFHNAYYLRFKFCPECGAMREDLLGNNTDEWLVNKHILSAPDDGTKKEP